MAEQNFVYVDVNYLKELEETAKKADYYKGIIDGINMVIDRKTEAEIDIHDLTDCDFCKDRNCKDCEGGKDEPQTVLEAVLEKQTDDDRRKMAESVRKAIKGEQQTERSSE